MNEPVTGNTGEAFSGDYQSLAGFWPRCKAMLIDFSILLFPYVVVIVMFALWILPDDAEGIPRQYVGPLMLINVFFRVGVPLVYFTLFVGRTGMTIGKNLAGLKVVHQDGSPVDYATACFRYFFIIFLANAGVIISQLNLIGWVLLLASSAVFFFDKKKRMLHDLLFKTVVLSKAVPPPV